jgi:hypothetical protein
MRQRTGNSESDAARNLLELRAICSIFLAGKPFCGWKRIKKIIPLDRIADL